jgi:hypothetical protein
MILRKSLLTGIVIAWFVFLYLVAFVFREIFSHTYYHLIKDMGNTLPLLTKKIAIPILGADALNAENEWLFYIFWGIIWIVPVIILSTLLRIPDRIKLMEFWVYSWSIYMVFFFLSTSLVICGLLLPFLFI